MTPNNRKASTIAVIPLQKRINQFKWFKSLVKLIESKQFESKWLVYTVNSEIFARLLFREFTISELLASS